MRAVIKRGITQLGVLATLAIFTVAVPLTGFVGVDTSLAVPGRNIVVANGDAHSWAYSDDTKAHAEEGTDTNVEAASAPNALIQRGDVQAKARIVEAKKRPTLPSCDVKSAARGEASVLGAINEDTVYYPLKKGTFQISSPFGYRISPMAGLSNLHDGVDMSAPLMTPVLAALKGKVTFVGPWGGGGNIIRIEHERDGKKFFTQYLHLTSGSAVVKEGQMVKAGQHIAGVGSTGNSTGPHLHFEVRYGMSSPVDPWKWLQNHDAIYFGEESC